MNRLSYTRRILALGIAGISAVVLFLGGAATVSAQAPTAPLNPTTGKMRGGERHPEINRALKNLQMAQSNLQHASKDFGGHKEKAMDLIKQAQVELAQAKQFDKN